jgi:hypothetical protein
MLDKSHVSIVSALIGSPQSHDATGDRKSPSGQSEGKGHRANSLKLVNTMVFCPPLSDLSPHLSVAFLVFERVVGENAILAT